MKYKAGDKVIINYLPNLTGEIAFVSEGGYFIKFFEFEIKYPDKEKACKLK